MIIAGFDIATRTGICFMRDNRVIYAESWRASVKRPAHLGKFEADPEYESHISDQFRQHIAELFTRYGGEHAAYEEPRTRDFERTKKGFGENGLPFDVKQRASSNLAMLRTFALCRDLCSVARQFSVSTVAVPADSWRKAFLGFARAPKGVDDGRKFLKESVIKQCRLVGYRPPDDDCADSIGVAWWLSGHLRGARLARPGELFAESVA